MPLLLDEGATCQLLANATGQTAKYSTQAGKLFFSHRLGQLSLLLRYRNQDGSPVPRDAVTVVRNLTCPNQFSTVSSA